MKSRGIFIDAVPLEEALKRWLDRVNPKPLGEESIKIIDSLGRVTARPVVARLSSPAFHSAAMDGYAVRFADTFGASETAPKGLKINEAAFYIDTGDPMPEGMNAVIMIEDVNAVDDSIEIISAVTPWQNVRTVGEDIVATELILPENHKIRPVDIGAMLAGGHVDVWVRRRPRVAVIPTGSELIELSGGVELKAGNIIEYNSRVMCGMASEWGGEPLRWDIVPNDLERLKGELSSACERADIVAVNAGSSAGSKDFTADAIASLGEIILHGLNIKPGKPAILGIVNGKPVIGVPGYPVSSYIVFSVFAKAVVDGFLGVSEGITLSLSPETIKAHLSRPVASQLGQEEFLRMKVGRVGGKFIATPLGRGAGLMMSLVRADGFLRIPSMSEGVGGGAEVDIELLRSKSEIENTIVFIGSHDNSLDILANALKKKHPLLSLSSAHVGSMAGLIAIGRDEAHVAPTHLLDEETGEYNMPFIRRLLPGKKITLINLLYRLQGLMVKKGNPKAIKGFEDLVREDIYYINRQRGAGTRLLLDKCLKERSIAPSDVKGYGREEYTHMAVASAVLSGVADAGLGVLSAANALGLDFIPVAEERYDLAIPSEFLETDMLKALLEIIREDAEFRKEVLSLGGYDARDMGKVVGLTN